MKNRFKATKTVSTGRQRSSRLPAAKPSAFSYYSRRSEQLLNTGRQIARSETAEKTRLMSRYWRQRFGFGILIVTAVLCLVYISTLTTDPRVVIEQTTASPVVLQDVSVYRAAASAVLRESILNQNKISIGTTTLADELLLKFPELAAVQVSLPLLTHRVQLRLVPAEPVLILASATGSYALDANGTALVTGSQLAALSTLNLPLVTDESDMKVAVHKQAVSSDSVLFISTVLAQLAAQNIPVASTTLPAGTSELHLRLTNEPYFIKFNLANNTSRQQVGTLIAVYDRLKSQGITPGQYIDVRVDGRAYYK